MRHVHTAELVVVALALAGATAAKILEMIDSSTTIGVLASIGLGGMAAGAMCAVGLWTTIYYRRATRQ